MDKLCALILGKDYLSQLEETLQNLMDNEIEDVIICNCYKGRESRDAKMIVENFSQIHNLNFVIFDHKFKNYSEARNALFDFADEMTTKDTVYLITDPGDMLKIIDKEELERCILDKSNIAFFIKQVLNNNSWYLFKLVVSHNKYIRYHRFAHEYIHVGYGRTKTECILQYRNVKDSFDKEFLNRCNTVRPLLEEELIELEKQYVIGDKETELLFARTLFYLGQEYGCIKDFEKAYYFYTRRVQLEGFIEEKFEAYKRLIEISDLLKKDKHTISYYFKEACKLQKRAEVYIQYIRYLVSIKTTPKELDYIHELCEECLALQPPKNTILFFNENSYKKERMELYLSIFPPKFVKPKECEVCYNNPEVRLLKCKHWCCEKCIENLNLRRCPFCRQAI